MGPKSTNLNLKQMMGPGSQDVALRDPLLHFLQARDVLFADPGKDRVVGAIWSQEPRINEHTVGALNNLTCFETVCPHIRRVQRVLVCTFVFHLCIEVMCSLWTRHSYFLQNPLEFGFCIRITHVPRRLVSKGRARSLDMLATVANDVMETVGVICTENFKKCTDPFHSIAEHDRIQIEVIADTCVITLVGEPLVRVARLCFAKGPR